MKIEFCIMKMIQISTYFIISLTLFNPKDSIHF